MDWYPGAWKVNIGGNGRSLSYLPGENIFHIVAASWNINQADPYSTGYAGGYWENNHPCITYTDQYGNQQQFCTVREQQNGILNGNYRGKTHEAWNPSSGDLNESRYTDEQAERFADWLYWDAKENGAKLQDMGNSKASSHGVGVHRYGVTAYSPYKDVGGEVWSTSSNKLCPGDARIFQVRNEIIPRAQWLLKNDVPYLPAGRVDLKTALNRGNTKKGDWFDMATQQDLKVVVSANNDDAATAVLTHDVGQGLSLAQEVIALKAAQAIIVKGLQDLQNQVLNLTNVINALPKA